MGGSAIVQPTFTGELSWYDTYVDRIRTDGADGRLVSVHSFDGAWEMWELHPVGAEVVLCISGTMELVQELETGDVATVLHEGEYAINEPGVWHTANDTGPCTAVFITAGLGTEHRPR